ncbi:unnamed protein product [Polarella glacialis]|uniref:Uncharacterized protein n=1 Tax=Polarella glacialis TaxID=89957 RepID=A0A813G471_POLGL|nr:unnamed protein product [Polarella glacialis]
MWTILMRPAAAAECNAWYVRASFSESSCARGVSHGAGWSTLVNHAIDAPGLGRLIAAVGSSQGPRPPKPKPRGWDLKCSEFSDLQAGCSLCRPATCLSRASPGVKAACLSLKR